MNTTAPTAKPTGGPPPARRHYREFVTLWLTGLIQPARAYQELTQRPAPAWGALSGGPETLPLQRDAGEPDVAVRDLAD